MSWPAVVAVILLIAGGALELLAVLGLCVMRNVYDRLKRSPELRRWLQERGR